MPTVSASPPLSKATPPLTANGPKKASAVLARPARKLVAADSDNPSKVLVVISTSMPGIVAIFVGS